MNEDRKAMKWYEAAYIVMLLVLLVLSVSFLTPHRVAVVNVQRIMREVGVEERLNAALQEKQDEARARVAAIREDFVQRAEAVSGAIPGAADEEEKEALRGQLAGLQADYQKRVNAVGAEVHLFRREAVLTFRERLQPHLTKLARRRRLDVVIEPASVVYVAKAMDVTDLVIERASGAFPADLPLVDRALLKERGLLTTIEPVPVTDLTPGGAAR